METLPSELKYRILLNSTYKEISRWCQVDWSFRDICESEYFWTQKAKVDFGDDAQIFPDRFTSPATAYLELYSQYHLPMDCEKYLSSYGCIIRAIEDKNLHEVISLIEMSDQYENIGPYRISLKKNYIPGIKYFGSKLAIHKYFVYGMTLTRDEIESVLDVDDGVTLFDKINELFAGAVYSGRKDIFTYLADKYPVIDPINAAYITGKANGKLDYLIGSAPENELISYYIKGLLESGWLDDLSIVGKVDFDTTDYLKSVINNGKGDPATIKYLLSRGAKVDEPMIENAVENYNFRGVQVLINEDMDVNYRFSFVLNEAIRTKNRYMVKYLLAKGADVNMMIDNIANGYYFISDIRDGLEANDGAIFKTLILATSRYEIERLLDLVHSDTLRTIYDDYNLGHI